MIANTDADGDEARRALLYRPLFHRVNHAAGTSRVTTIADAREKAVMAVSCIVVRDMKCPDMERRKCHPLKRRKRRRHSHLIGG